MSEKSMRAKAYFEEGYNCCQAVVLTYAEEVGLDQETALKIAASFGGGMGQLREVCGAVTGMFIVEGMKHGYTSPTDKVSKKAHYQRIQDLAAKFREKNGSIVCKELLGLTAKPKEANPAERTAEYYKKRPCADLVECAAAIVEKTL
ncbi:hypothetical protein CE91St36_18830 [Christensenellaceae bacterium]|nr:hypothetical protein CE91St36_18830 [Christensenellaceae bacterium]BDF61733.1 hypothetical protein CE91St37_18830 [Christensenellaceae bacterium]